VTHDERQRSRDGLARRAGLVSGHRRRGRSGVRLRPGGGGRAAGGYGLLALTVVLALGRRRIDAIRVVGGAGDERNRDLYVRSLAVAGGVLGLAVTGWYLISVARGEPDGTLLVLTVLFAAVFVGAGVVGSWRG
jgi:hypothetical protein